MTLYGRWVSPRDLQMLTDLEFRLKDGSKVMISWESATFNKREFNANGVSTTDEHGRVTSGNLDFLRENLDTIERIHYLSRSTDASHIEELVFSDARFGSINSESWTFKNKNFIRHVNMN